MAALKFDSFDCAATASSLRRLAKSKSLYIHNTTASPTQFSRAISRRLRSRVVFSKSVYYPRADGAKCRARVLIPPGYSHPGKGTH